MKTIKFMFMSFLMTTFYVSGYAQVKIASDGRVSIATTNTVPSGYAVLLNSVRTQMLYGSTDLSFNLGPSNPRITNNTSDIVFYKTDGSGFVNIQVGTCYQYSDVNAKKNITTVSNGLNKIKNLRGVTFNWKENSNSSQLKSSTVANPKLEYGLIAQEVEKVLPELVLTNDSTKNKVLNYSGIIPVLIEAVKDLSSQIEIQKKQLDALNGNSNLKGAPLSTISTIGDTLAILEQNAPNPFSTNTAIGFFLPESVKTAVINIYDMNGLQIKSIPIQLRGKGNTLINGSELRPGMYLYTLLADGKEIGTKRMILTQ